MQRLSRNHLLAFFLFICLAVPNHVCQAQTEQPVKTDEPQHQRQGFFDYALGKINSTDDDYGASIASKRDSLLMHTVDDLYFWSNVVTLVLLAGSVGIILFEWRASDKKEIIAASIIAELWNGRVSDGVEIERRTEQFNQLVEVHNAEAEKLLAAGLNLSEQEREGAGSLSKSIRQLAETSAPTHGKGASPEPIATTMDAAATQNANTAKLQQNNLLLQRRVEALQNNEQNLKQRLNQTTLLLDEERRRNATLKGA